VDSVKPIINRETFIEPLPADEARKVELVKGPNIASLPVVEALPDSFELPVLLKVGDDVTTDAIMPAGTRVLPFRSNIPKIAEFSFDLLDPTYVSRAKLTKGHVIVAGANYGQGSSREHAALGPRFLGLRIVLAKGFARIHSQNLVNFGVLPLIFSDPRDYDRVLSGDLLRVADVRRALAEGGLLRIENVSRQEAYAMRHLITPRQVQLLLSGGLLNWMKHRFAARNKTASAPPAVATA